MNRRQFLQFTLAASALTAPALLSACGSSDPEPTPISEAPASAPANTSSNNGQPAAATDTPTPVTDNSIKLGFIALTDSAPLLMAEALGLYKEQGIDVQLVRAKSWAEIRDKLLSGEFHAAHCLFGMPFSVYTGIGGAAGKELKIAMTLNANGQGITLRKGMAATAGYGDLAGAKEALTQFSKDKNLTLAMTFPGGTHDMWLRYWLGATKVDINKVTFKTIPPPEMVANMQIGGMDGYCVGEPWNGVGVAQDVGYTHLATQDIWTDHPEKALVVNPEFAATRRDDLKKVMYAILEASIWLDKIENRKETATVLSDAAHVNAPVDAILGRLEGRYILGAGLPDKTFTNDYMFFHKDGAVNTPRTAHAIWFMSQYVRFGYLKDAPDYRAIADQLIMHDLYKEVAGEMKLTLPDDDMTPFTLKLDNVTFDPAKPEVALKQWSS